MHGNEVVGRELLLLLSEHILKNYAHDHLMESLVNKTRIHVMPMLNPDGASKAIGGNCNSNKGKLNSNGVDLYNDFEGQFISTIFHAHFSLSFLFSFFALFFMFIFRSLFHADFSLSFLCSFFALFFMLIFRSFFALFFMLIVVY